MLRNSWSIQNLKGSVTFNNIFGDINLSGLIDISSLSIDASKSDIHLIIEQINQYQYELEAKFGEVMVPKNIKEKIDTTSPVYRGGDIGKLNYQP